MHPLLDNRRDRLGHGRIEQRRSRCAFARENDVGERGRGFAINRNRSIGPERFTNQLSARAFDPARRHFLGTLRGRQDASDRSGLLLIAALQQRIAQPLNLLADCRRSIRARRPAQSLNDREMVQVRESLRMMLSTLRLVHIYGLVLRDNTNDAHF